MLRNSALFFDIKIEKQYDRDEVGKKEKKVIFL